MGLPQKAEDDAARAREVVDAVYRSDSRRVLATLIRLLGDFDRAEEAMHDAFVAAVEQWPKQGLPANPRAWLVSAGRFKAIDNIRRRARFDATLTELAQHLDTVTNDPAEGDEQNIEDDRLRLIFTCCHPALPPDAQVALTLREVCGLTTEEIARSFLTAAPTIAKRIVRAKGKIRDAHIPYEVPSETDLPERLDTVLSVIYLLFTEGYSASSGVSLTRADISIEAIRLGRLLVDLLPEPEAVGLLALMLLQESRRAARSSAEGEVVLLEDQDRSLWNQGQIAEGTALVKRALSTRRIGSYTLQAAIAAVHAEAPNGAATDWAQIVGLYDVLLSAHPSPVVELNRAVAVAMRDGPSAGPFADRGNSQARRPWGLLSGVLRSCRPESATWEKAGSARRLPAIAQACPAGAGTAISAAAIRGSRSGGKGRMKLSDLRLHAIASSLFPETSLRRAIGRLGFIQADPIRSPARAQDLILRQRVTRYRAGDLDRNYRALKLEEDYLYAYGFMPIETWQLLHPRKRRSLTRAEQKVLDIVANQKHLHPRELETHLGKSLEVNAWGGSSKATTRSLERLHYLGLIRIAGRVKGIKLYQRATISHEPLDPAERLRRLVLLIASILAPLPESSLRAAVQHLRYSAPDLAGRKGAVASLLKSGALESTEADGVRYVWPSGRLKRSEPPEVVRFLAPFDPLVWDRRRFEHFWGWPYRFEAYTPPAKRKLGYYALPLLWRADVIGWVNVSGRGNELTINPGFVSGQPPSEKAFHEALAMESERLRYFLSMAEEPLPSRS